MGGTNAFNITLQDNRTNCPICNLWSPIMEGTYDFDAIGIALPKDNVPPWSREALAVVQRQFTEAAEVIRDPDRDDSQAAAAIEKLRNEMRSNSRLMEDRLQDAFTRKIDDLAEDLREAKSADDKKSVRRKIGGVLAAIIFVLAAVNDVVDFSKMTYHEIWPLVQQAIESAVN